MILGRFQFRRDTVIGWSNVNPTLLSGEYGLEPTLTFGKPGMASRHGITCHIPVDPRGRRDTQGIRGIWVPRAIRVRGLHGVHGIHGSRKHGVHGTVWIHGLYGLRGHRAERVHGLYGIHGIHGIHRAGSLYRIYWLHGSERVHGIHGLHRANWPFRDKRVPHSGPGFLPSG